jgi:ABC-type uncharacterized transport system substrate-binding protein
MFSRSLQSANTVRIFKALLLLCLSLSIILTQTSCSNSPESIDQEHPKSPLTPEHVLKNRKKVLLVNSYHQDYFWTGGITTAILKQFEVTIDEQGTIDNSRSKVILKIIDMDTKRNQSEKYIKRAAIDVKKLIKTWQPDLVITSDDNAAKYLIVPYFKNSNIPFVFCGVNWDATDYGFPVSNVTGMIEVQLIDQIVKTLKKYTKGDRVALLKGDDFSARKEADFFEKRFNIKLIKRFVKSFSEWQNQYQLLQSEADIILVGNAVSIPDWTPEKAIELVRQVTQVPTGNWDESMNQFNLLTLATKAEEQGDWAAETALKILNGTSPSDIPMVTNHIAKVYLNMTLAKKLDVTFPIELIEQAVFVEKD